MRRIHALDLQCMRSETLTRLCRARLRREQRIDPTLLETRRREAPPVETDLARTVKSALSIASLPDPLLQAPTERQLEQIQTQHAILDAYPALGISDQTPLSHHITRGEFVVVVEELITDDEERVTLPMGMVGRVMEIDSDGDACTDFNRCEEVLYEKSLIYADNKTASTRSIKLSYIRPKLLRDGTGGIVQTFNGSTGGVQSPDKWIWSNKFHQLRALPATHTRNVANLPRSLSMISETRMSSQV